MGQQWTDYHLGTELLFHPPMHQLPPAATLTCDTSEHINKQSFMRHVRFTSVCLECIVNYHNFKVMLNSRFGQRQLISIRCYLLFDWLLKHICSGEYHVLRRHESYILTKLKHTNFKGDNWHHNLVTHYTSALGISTNIDNCY